VQANHAINLFTLGTFWDTFIWMTLLLEVVGWQRGWRIADRRQRMAYCVPRTDKDEPWMATRLMTDGGGGGGDGGKGMAHCRWWMVSAKTMYIQRVAIASLTLSTMDYSLHR
jgi:hypothetical protein